MTKKTKEFLSRFLENQFSDLVYQKLTTPIISLILSAVGFLWGRRIELLAKFYSWVDKMSSYGTLQSIIAFVIPALGFAVAIWMVITFFKYLFKKISESFKARFSNPESKKSLHSQSSNKLRIKSVIEGKDNSNIKEYASIRVENVGNDEIRCFAKLTKFSMIYRQAVYDPRTAKIENFHIDAINPKGSYLQWDDGNESADLKNGFPHMIRLVDKKAFLLFFGAPNHYVFPRHTLDGWFRIEIELLKYQNNKFTRIKTIKDTLLVLGIVRTPRLEGFHMEWGEPK